VSKDLETGDRLRSLYEKEGGAESIFSSKVAEYAASRPDYPAALFEALRMRANLVAGAVVADVGAGTGLLTHGLLRIGCRVVAVEPSPEMRGAADRLLGGIDGYRSVKGTAESIPLEAGSVHLITAAQAFHWFDVERARAEFLRVLRPEGQVALIWNDRITDDPVNLALEEIFAEFGGAKRAALVAHEERSNVPKFFGSATPIELSWAHGHRLDENGLLALVLSRSYMPGRGTPSGPAIEDRVRRAFRRFENGGAISVRYRTVAIIGRPS
jgi:SAM-dependent methyltransferase